MRNQSGSSVRNQNLNPESHPILEEIEAICIVWLSGLRFWFHTAEPLWFFTVEPKSLTRKSPYTKEIEVILYSVDFGSTQWNHLSEEPKERRGTFGSAPFCNFLCNLLSQHFMVTDLFTFTFWSVLCHLIAHCKRQLITHTQVVKGSFRNIEKIEHILTNSQLFFRIDF